MKRFLSVISLFFFAISLCAQTDVDKLVILLEEGRVSLNFECRLKGDVPLDLSGSVVAQGDCFHMQANGVESFCDGRTVVMLDREKKEAYVDSASGIRDFLIANYGMVADLKMSNVSKTEASGDFSPFVFDLSALDNSWVVTDLRE